MKKETKWEQAVRLNSSFYPTPPDPPLGRDAELFLSNDGLSIAIVDFEKGRTEVSCLYPNSEMLIRVNFSGKLQKKPFILKAIAKMGYVSLGVV